MKGLVLIIITLLLGSLVSGSKLEGSRHRRGRSRGGQGSDACPCECQRECPDDSFISAVCPCARRSPRFLCNNSALIDYVQKNDTDYQWELLESIETEGWTAHILNMTSQTWLNDDDGVEGVTWWHYLAVVEPASPDCHFGNYSMLYLAGQTNDDGPPNETNRDLQGCGIFANTTAATVLCLFQVPNQPLVFNFVDELNETDVNGTDPDVNGTDPNVNGTDPNPDVNGTDPNPDVNGTDPSVNGTDPDVNGTDPNMNGTDPNPDVNGTDPNPDVNGTDPNVNGTDPNPDVNGTDPDVNGTDPDVNGTDPSVNGTDPNPDVNGTDPDVNGTDPNPDVNGTDPNPDVNGTDPNPDVNGTDPNANGTETNGSAKAYGEAQLLALGWDRFYNDTSNTEWLLQLPMVKAAIRAMDTAQDFLQSLGNSSVPEKFIVSGYQSRGWAAWLTAAVDKRVAGVIPIAADSLNFQKSYMHLYQAYGGWPWPLVNYWEMELPKRLTDPETKMLANIIDPFVYRYQLAKIPKLILSVANDPSSQPDNHENYWDELPGEKHYRTLPNTENNLENVLETMLETMSNFVISICDETPRPKYSWSVDDLTGVITVHTITEPLQVRKWATASLPATQNETARRDFRSLVCPEGCDPHDLNTLQETNISWEVVDEDVQPVSPGLYREWIGFPCEENTWHAFFLELEFPGLEPNSSFLLSTGVSIVPRTFPFEPCQGEACQGIIV